MRTKLKAAKTYRKTTREVKSQNRTKQERCNIYIKEYKKDIPIHPFPLRHSSLHPSKFPFSFLDSIEVPDGEKKFTFRSSKTVSVFGGGGETRTKYMKQKEKKERKREKANLTAGITWLEKKTQLIYIFKKV